MKEKKMMWIEASQAIFTEVLALLFISGLDHYPRHTKVIIAFSPFSVNHPRQIS